MERLWYGVFGSGLGGGLGLIFGDELPGGNFGCRLWLRVDII